MSSWQAEHTQQEADLAGFRQRLPDYDGLLSGRSNLGLMEPGQNAAHTLTQLSAIVCLSEPKMDDLVAGDMMRMLRDEVPKSFIKRIGVCARTKRNIEGHEFIGEP